MAKRKFSGTLSNGRKITRYSDYDLNFVHVVHYRSGSEVYKKTNTYVSGPAGPRDEPFWSSMHLPAKEDYIINEVVALVEQK